MKKLAFFHNVIASPEGAWQSQTRIAAISIPLFLLAACGESTTENVTNINQMGMDVVASVDELPECTKENEGEQAFVKGETSARVCVDEKWFATKESVSDTVVVSKNDTLFVEGGNLSCETKPLADSSGIKVICNGDSIGVVKNGEQGIQGDPGAAGKDGAGCTIDKKGSKLAITCGEKSVNLELDEDGSIIGVEEVVLDSEKVAVSLDSVSGVTQKGPFLSGSKVLVKELEDGRSLTQTGNNFDGKILNDKGQFKITARMLVSQYVMLEATGYYRDEITGGVSNSTLTLFGISDVTTRNIVNINLLTHLEYERVIYLVTKKKMTVTAAKRQAQQEVFGLLDIDAKGFSSSEDLSIAGSSDEDGALLAFSVMFQGGRNVAQLTELLTKIATDMETDGTWDDASTKMAIADWSADADSSGKLDTIRWNVTNWNLSTMVPKFEPFVRHFWSKEYGLDSCNADSADIVKAATAGKRKGSKTRYICKEIGEDSGDFRWVIASDFEKDTYGWKKDTADGALKDGAITGKKYVFDKTGSFNGTAGWREAESIEQQHGGCREALYDSIRTDKVYAYYYTCKKSTHTWVREVDYLIIDTQYWPDSTDGKVKWGDSVGVVDNLTRICYVWDEAPQYNGWRAGNVSDCNLGLLGCTAKRGGEMRETSDGNFFSCSNNNWTEITDTVYINTYPYRCTIKEEGENVYKDGDLVYGIKLTSTRFACENEKWRSTKTGEEQVGMACTANKQGNMNLDSTRTCDAGNWRLSIVYDFPIGKDWTNPELKYDTLRDSLRDGRVYKTIKINGITVMAENLNYADSVNSPYIKGQSWCYNNDSTNCLKGGRYYSWTAAMNIDPKWQNASPYEVEGLIKTPHQGICPDGWHIPTNDEWKNFFIIGYAELISLNPQWENATNSSGFSAIPVGYVLPSQYGNDSFLGMTEVQYWSSSEYSVQNTISFEIRMQYQNGGEGRPEKKTGNMVRCFKD